MGSSRQGKVGAFEYQCVGRALLDGFGNDNAASVLRVKFLQICRTGDLLARIPNASC